MVSEYFSIHLKQIQAIGFDLGFYMAFEILESGLLKVNRASTPTQLYWALSHWAMKGALGCLSYIWDSPN